MAAERNQDASGIRRALHTKVREIEYDHSETMLAEASGDFHDLLQLRFPNLVRREYRWFEAQNVFVHELRTGK